MRHKLHHPPVNARYIKKWWAINRLYNLDHQTSRLYLLELGGLPPERWVSLLGSIDLGMSREVLGLAL